MVSAKGEMYTYAAGEVWGTYSERPAYKAGDAYAQMAFKIALALQQKSVKETD